jgi:uncharacterized protein YxjI
MKLLLALLLGMSSLPALTRLPEEFTVVERFISWTNTFDINTDLGTFALARKSFFSLTPTFTLEDDQGRPLASAKAHFFSWGTVADVTGPEGEIIGRIEEEVWRILPWAEYQLFDAEDHLVAIARMNFWGTHFNLFPPEDPDHIYATIERPFLRAFRDYWTVQVRDYAVFETGKIDPRLLIMIAVYQTDKDNRDRTRNEILEILSRQLDQYQ